MDEFPSPSPEPEHSRPIPADARLSDTSGGPASAHGDSTGFIAILVLTAGIAALASVRSSGPPEGALSPQQAAAGPVLPAAAAPVLVPLVLPAQPQAPAPPGDTPRAAAKAAAQADDCHCDASASLDPGFSAGGSWGVPSSWIGQNSPGLAGLPPSKLAFEEKGRGFVSADQLPAVEACKK